MIVPDINLLLYAYDLDSAFHTNDTDFMRFSGLRWFNPLTGAANAKLSKG